MGVKKEWKEYGITAYCGDCLDIIPTLEKVDFTFTSPPYNRKRNDKYLNYDDRVEDWFGWQQEIISKLIHKTNKTVMYNIQASHYNRQDVYKLIGSFCKNIQDIHIWEKSNPMPAQGDKITNSVEYFIMLGEKLRSNKTYTKNIITSSVNPDTMKEHKAIMNIKIALHFIKNFTKENDSILDAFAGSGTTAVACIKENRRCIVIEKDPEYFKIMLSRIEHAIVEKRSQLFDCFP